MWPCYVYIVDTLIKPIHYLEVSVTFKGYVNWEYNEALGNIKKVKVPMTPTKRIFPRPII